MKNVKDTEETRIEKIMNAMDDAVIANFSKVVRQDFTIRELETIQKAGLTKDDVLNLVSFWNSKKGRWTNSLIIKSFIQYRKNIEEIMGLEDFLFYKGVCTDHHKFTIRDLDLLARNIKEPKDYDLFLQIHEQHKYGLNYLKHEFLKAKKGQAIA